MKDATEIIVVMDKSGSMANRAADAIGGFNTFIKEQQAEPGEACLTLVLFDTTYSFAVPLGTPLKDVKPLTEETYRPGGNTALLDALARAIIETGNRLDDMDEADRPDKVICVVITDGEENSSKEHTPAQVMEMVTHQEEKYNWAFMYLGTQVDAFAEAGKLGIQPAMSAQFSGGSQGTKSAYAGTSRGVSSYRSGGKSGLDKSDWKKGIN